MWFFLHNTILLVILHMKMYIKITLLKNYYFIKHFVFYCNIFWQEIYNCLKNLFLDLKFISRLSYFDILIHRMRWINRYKKNIQLFFKRNMQFANYILYVIFLPFYIRTLIFLLLFRTIHMFKMLKLDGTYIHDV